MAPAYLKWTTACRRPATPRAFQRTAKWPRARRGVIVAVDDTEVTPLN